MNIPTANSQPNKLFANYYPLLHCGVVDFKRLALLTRVGVGEMIITAVTTP